jgi:transposase
MKPLTHKGVIGKLPVFPIEKCMASPALLAQILVDKFVDHLPVYRQLERFKREGISISSSTINGWQESV